MAKKPLTQTSLKIKKQPTQQLNNLIKVLKPKVFITNSSNFKTLVQELTGNGSSSPESSSFSPLPPIPEPAHVIQIDDHDSPDPSLDHSLDCSPDPSLDNMFMPFDYSNCSSEELGLQWSHDPLMDHVNEIELKNLESWLLDFDSSTCNHDALPFVPMNTYEYDYNLSSIM
ncbi:hypothetical protein QVD17_29072 [Tagetes erecta]|uniref:VQ domain-containing protein n=1 Tax=Tagetes erecta TaxID=13708 RepID=A0AAD8NT82_TARER|nr:hypothetical protein QVD17_29072 [Tagetes erecta]